MGDKLVYVNNSATILLIWYRRTHGSRSAPITLAHGSLNTL